MGQRYLCSVSRTFWAQVFQFVLPALFALATVSEYGLGVVEVKA